MEDYELRLIPALVVVLLLAWAIAHFIAWTPPENWFYRTIIVVIVIQVCIELLIRLRK